MRKNTCALLIGITILCQSLFATEKLFTIKGIYNLPTELNTNVSNGDYDGSAQKWTYDINDVINSGLGLGAEMKISELKLIKKDLDIIGGVSYMTSRKIPKFSGNLTIAGNTDTNYEDVELSDDKIEIGSIYVKARCLFLPKEESTNFYISGKLAYNGLSLIGDIKKTTKLNSGFGVGGSVGILIDELDVELAMDNIGGTAKFDDDTDTLTGDYLIKNTTLSLGYRF